MAAITITDLENAKADVDTIDAFANSSDPTVVTRAGDEVPTRAGLTAMFPFAEAAATASTRIYATTSAGIAATVNGDYFFVPASDSSATLILYKNSSGSAIEVKRYPSATYVDYLSAVDRASDGTATTIGAMVENATLSSTTTVYGLRVPYDCELQAINLRVFAAGTGRVVIARRKLLHDLTHEVESVTSVTIAASGLNSIAMTTRLYKGDIVMYGTVSGAQMRWNNASTNKATSLANPTVGLQFLSDHASIEPAMQLQVVRAGRLDAVGADVVDLQAGLGSVGAEVQTIGDSSAGDGSPNTTAFFTFGSSETAPTGVLTQVKHKTNTPNRIVDYTIILFRLVTTATYEVAGVYPISALTDANGYAVATPDDFGAVHTVEGDRIHVTAYRVDGAVCVYTGSSINTRNGSLGPNNPTLTIGNQFSLNGTYGNAVAMEFTVETTQDQQLQARLDDEETASSGIATALGTATTLLGTLSTELTASGHDQPYGYIVPNDCTLTEFSVNVSASGTGELYHCRQVGVFSGTTAAWRVLEKVAVAPSAAGNNSFSANISAKAGDLIAYATKSGGFLRFTNSLDGGQGYRYQGNQVVGAIFTRVTIVMGSLRLSLASVDYSALTGGFAAPPGEQVKEFFPGTTLPADWTQAGGWTVSDGLVAPASGSWNVFALHANKSSVAKRKLGAKIQVNNATSVFGIATSDGATGAPLAGGAVAMVDGSVNKLKILTWDGSNPGSGTSEVALPAALTVGRSYTLELAKNGLTLTATFTDPITLQSCTVSETQSANYKQLHGKPGVIFISGAIKVEWFEAMAPYQRELRAIVIGDSNSEGNHLPLASPTWAYQLAAARSTQNDVLLSVKAGDANEILNKLTNDLSTWEPRYVVVSLGTNFSNQDVWRAFMTTLISNISAAGGEPILCTLIPKATASALIQAMNTDIRTGFFGRYRYIDHSKAVTVSHAGVTIDPAYDFGDGLHANYAGQQAMYSQTLADAPFLNW